MDFKDYQAIDLLETDGNDEIEYDDDTTDLTSASANFTDDPVKVYMREMGRFPLLDKTQEIELAKQIEAGHRAAHEATFRTRLAITEIRKLLYKIVTAKKRASDIIDMSVSSTSTQNKERKLREQVKKALHVLETLETERLTAGPNASGENGMPYTETEVARQWIPTSYRYSHGKLPPHLRALLRASVTASFLAFSMERALDLIPSDTP